MLTKFVNFNAEKMKASMLQIAITEQNKRLVDYAKKKIQEIGNTIKTFHSRNNLDRTGNLLNSLCWGVSYKGQMVESGFYRAAQIHSKTNTWGQERGMGVKGGTSSYLHEFFNEMEEVNGRQLAESYLADQSGVYPSGWRVFFAILAPYWGYWESGFTLRPGFQAHGRTRFFQFSVMSQHYTRISMDLKPAEMKLSVYVPKYFYKDTKYKKRGVKHIGKTK
jgi:hypothetical protein